MILTKCCHFCISSSVHPPCCSCLSLHLFVLLSTYQIRCHFSRARVFKTHQHTKTTIKVDSVPLDIETLDSKLLESFINCFFFTPPRDFFVSLSSTFFQMFRFTFFFFIIFDYPATGIKTLHQMRFKRLESDLDLV